MKNLRRRKGERERNLKKKRGERGRNLRKKRREREKNLKRKRGGKIPRPLKVEIMKREMKRDVLLMNR